MQSTTITFLPTALPDIDYIVRGDEDISETFPIAEYNGSTLSFSHKITLSGTGKILQVMTQDEDGLFTEALAENAFGIDGDFLGIELLSPVSGQNGFRYSARFFKDSNTRNSKVPGTLSEIILPDASNNPPQVLFAEVTDTSGTTIARGMGFIGTVDIRAASYARLFVRPGETVYVKRDSRGNLVFQF